MAKMIQCKSCSREIASSAKACPGCGAKNKKPIYKRPWFIIVAFLIIVGAIGDALGSSDTTTTNSGTSETKQEVSEKETAKEAATESIPTEYKSALKKAEVYAGTMSMSKSKLYDQLTSEYGEKFPAEAAQYAIDNIEADWKENALKKAKTYQESMSMSTSKIYDQLTSDYGEKFTAEEAQYAIDNLE